MVKNCTLYLWTCTGHVISHDVPDRFWSSIAYPRRKHIWTTTSNVNNNAPTLASHHSPWLYGQKLYFILMDMYRPCDISWCTRPFLTSIAYPRRKHIWTTTSNVNNNAPTLASHHSPWLCGDFCRNFVENCILKVMLCEYHGSDWGGQCLGWLIYMWDIAVHADEVGVGTLSGSFGSISCVFCPFFPKCTHFSP